MLLASSLAVTLISISSQLAEANIAPGANAAPFSALCRLMQIQSTGAPADEHPGDIAALIAELEAINMSLSGPKWQTKFVKAEESQVNWDDGENKDRDKHPHWKNEWSSWAAARQAIKKGTAVAQKLEQNSFSKIQGLHREIARLKIEQALQKTKKLQESAAAAATTLTEATKTEVDKDLNQAIYGDDSGLGGFGTNGANHAQYKAVTQCDSDGIAQSKATVAYAMMCLCLEAGGATGAKPCEASTKTGNWNGADTDLAAEFQKVKKLCHTTKKATVSADSIRSALDHVHSLIKIVSNAGYLGHYENTGCTGTSNQGLCVRYATKLTDTADDFHSLHFVQKMEEAAKKLQQRQAALDTVRTAHRAVGAELAAAWLLAKEQQVKEQQSQVAASSPSHPSKPATEAVEVQKKECEAIEKDTDCDSKPYCTYQKDSADDKKCKFNATKAEKSGVPVTPTQTGGTENGKTDSDRCTKHTKKEECEAENKNVKAGEKAVCGWIEEKCKDSSFDLNKKFTLMVSAFVALLF
ncbi:variant surface glycoprotein (VSG), putative [Trypanosoma brucei brucei TREU927]|uniref:Variant surface glycoprotein (VSG), putative n=1 Tax=Trypanosoma brucei brucei (strain 927/4 GUTat10.1) TaxID=185431 RepID=Q57TR4_TRYB2|nr:variant surface glycoprotein (VSG), putative [Trypanosoma brucei brucei TREU927]AAX81073.1 variant surface glycoprotein (VSG), putative [Trypanosoma brucei]AAZ10089.1 variant surface glycoprotein (VSG), putative [Trypanosoma brucei brucei TREU927]